MKLSFSFGKNKRAVISSLVIAALMATSGSLRAQADSTEAEPTKVPVTRTFRGPQLINMPTNEISAGLTFGIQHRFGQIIDKDIIYDFLGLDLSANIRFSLGYTIIPDRFMVEVGRTKNGKMVDLELKYQLLRQTEKNEMPISLDLYFDPAVTTTRYTTPQYAYFAPLADSNVFKYTFAHRLSYNSQLIISRKFCKKFSMMVNPVWIHQNLVAYNPDSSKQRQHNTFGIQTGARFKFSNKGSVMLEYGHAFTNNKSIDSLYVDPLSVGVEFSTAGHVFQIVLSSSNDILMQGIMTTNNVAIKNGIFLGFNMKRFF